MPNRATESRPAETPATTPSGESAGGEANTAEATCRHCRHGWHDAGECASFDCFCGYAAAALHASPDEWKRDALATTESR